jgi:hypothetical protein
MRDFEEEGVVQKTEDAKTRDVNLWGSGTSPKQKSWALASFLLSQSFEQPKQSDNPPSDHPSTLLFYPPHLSHPPTTTCDDMSAQPPTSHTPQRQSRRHNNFKENINFFEPGKQGRRTGLVLKDTGVRDEHGFEPVSGIFSSPQPSPQAPSPQRSPLRSPQRAQANGNDTALGSSSMVLQDSTRRSIFQASMTPMLTYSRLYSRNLRNTQPTQDSPSTTQGSNSAPFEHSGLAHSSLGHQARRHSIITTSPVNHPNEQAPRLCEQAPADSRS